MINTICIAGKNNISVNCLQYLIKTLDKKKLPISSNSKLYRFWNI